MDVRGSMLFKSQLMKELQIEGKLALILAIDFITGLYP